MKYRIAPLERLFKRVAVSEVAFYLSQIRIALDALENVIAIWK